MKSAKGTMAEFMGGLPHCDEHTKSERKSTRYFQELATVSAAALKLHEAFGLWEKDASGESWANVTDHCLAAAARTDVLGTWTRLNEFFRTDLKRGAVAHDAFKRRQSEIRKKLGPTLEASKEAFRQEDAGLRKEGVPHDVIYITSAANFLATPEADRILAKSDEEQTDLEVAFLIMYLVDAYTLNADWAVGDDINYRINNTKGDPKKNAERYREVEPLFEGLRRTAHAVQKRLTARISRHTGALDMGFLPEDLPLKVDDQIRGWLEAG